jgi:hypothetical protein
VRARTLAHYGSRRLGGIALVLAAAALIPTALAFACNPQAYLTLDRSAYAPGDSVRVSGSFFRGDTSITVSIDRTGQSSTVRTSGNGSFSTTFQLPSSAATGGYTVSAIGYEANLEVIPGLPARASFSVGAPQSTPAPATSPAPSASSGGEQPAAAASQPAVAQPAAPQGSRPTTPRPSSGGPAPAFREPIVFTEPNVESSPAQRASSRGGAARGDRATVGGRAVFGGSVAPALTAPATTGGSVAAVTPTAATATGAPAGRSEPGRPRGASQPAAVSPQVGTDVWGAQAAGRSPSVVPVAGDRVAVETERDGSLWTLGLLLLAAGALVAVAGLIAAADARRRRLDRAEAVLERQHAVLDRLAAAVIAREVRPSDERETVPARDGQSEETTQRIDEEIERLLSDTHAR